MLLTTLALAWYFYDSARWFSIDTRELATASGALSEYESIARHTWQSLQDMEEAVRTGRPVMAPGSGPAADTVKESLARLRLAEGAGTTSGNNDAAVALLAELEASVDEIFRAILLIESALLAEQETIVMQTLTRLDTAGTISRFRGLIDSAIEQRQTGLAELEAEAVSLADYVVRLLPLIMLLLVIGTLVVAWRFSARLSRSLAALQTAAEELARGNLQHRVPELAEREFQRLGNAFNEMAAELDGKERQLQESNVSLEATVGERTRALKDSNEKLALVDEHRRKLLAEISHEFRTPLTVIRGESEIALRGGDKALTTYQEAFRRIIDTADHATSLVEDLLFIVRADAGEPRLQFQRVDMGELLRGVCEEFGGKAAGKSLEIRFHDESDQVALQGDSRRLRQVFAILLDNALRYSHAGGSIDVNSTRVEGGVQVTVQDEGIGLSDEEAAHAFERFVRGRQAQSHADQGSGLGLPVAQAIVEAHGGSISIAARPESGATATVTLPLQDGLRSVA